MTRWIEMKLGPLSASDREWVDLFVERLERVMKNWRHHRPAVRLQREREFDAGRPT